MISSIGIEIVRKSEAFEEGLMKNWLKILFSLPYIVQKQIWDRKSSVAKSISQRKCDKQGERGEKDVAVNYAEKGNQGVVASFGTQKIPGQNRLFPC